MEVLRLLEVLVGQFEMLNAVEGIDTRFVAGLAGAIEFFDDTKDVPTLLEDLESQRREVEDMRFGSIETKVRDKEFLMVTQCFDDGGEVLSAFGDMLVDDLVLQFAAGVERLAEGELGEEPLFGLAVGVVIGVGDIIDTTLSRAFALDFDIEDSLDIVFAPEERAVGESRFVVLVVMGVHPLTVNLRAGDFACAADGIYQPDVAVVLC